MFNFMVGVIAGLAIGVYMPGVMPKVASLFSSAGQTISQSINDNKSTVSTKLNNREVNDQLRKVVLPPK